MGGNRWLAILCPPPPRLERSKAERQMRWSSGTKGNNLGNADSNDCPFLPNRIFALFYKKKGDSTFSFD
jgi:hypothetical protein